MKGSHLYQSTKKQINDLSVLGNNTAEEVQQLVDKHYKTNNIKSKLENDTD